MLANSNRREFLQSFSAAAVGAGMIDTRQRPAFAAEADDKPLYRISLAEWSLHRTINAGKLDNLDFAKTAKEEFDIDAVEYVNQFFKDKAQDKKYLVELAARAEDHGVQSLLIMVDGEGALGDADEAQRKQAIENHHKWLEAARFLGCHSIRVNAASSGTYDEQLDRAADGLARLGELADQFGLNVLVENHGGLSSNGAWLAGVMEKVARPNVGTLPDFGNFQTSPGEWYDRYQGVTELMPFAKAVSAKSHEFDAAGNEVATDYRQMMKIVLDAGYRGYVGIEWEGTEPDEMEGIRLTKKLLERVREELS
ncbi:MAG: sugar phosphate isomerase/epimerase family protein [Pirellulales bacterium]